MELVAALSSSQATSLDWLKLQLVTSFVFDTTSLSAQQFCYEGKFFVGRSFFLAEVYSISD